MKWTADLVVTEIIGPDEKGYRYAAMVDETHAARLEAGTEDTRPRAAFVVQVPEWHLGELPVGAKVRVTFATGGTR